MTATNEPRSRDQTLVLVLAWLAVGAPLLGGVAQTISKGHGAVRVGIRRISPAGDALHR